MAIANVVVTKTPLGTGPLRPGMRSDAGGKAIKNVLLLSLPEDEYNLLRPNLEFQDLPHYQILFEPNEKIQYAYFLNDGMASLVVLSANGRSVEVGIVGPEGMLGMPLLGGFRQGFLRAIMQIPGNGVRVRSEALVEIFSASPVLRDALSRYALVSGLQAGQIAACNRLHEIDQRLARWLLMCQDRVDSGVLPLTHEFLAQMLGTSRPSMSLAIAMLERTGVIENRRGRVTIINRKQLETMACECYGVIQNFNGALGLK